MSFVAEILPKNALIGDGARSITTVADEVARLSQALLDLSQCDGTSVSVAHAPSRSVEAELVRDLARTGAEAGYVTAHLPLDEYPLDAIEDLVSALLDALVPPSGGREKGILRLLDLYADKRGSKSVERFDEAADEQGAAGDLRALCRSYLAAEDDAHREVKAFTQWAGGAEPSVRLKVEGVRGVLDAHSGQRVFGQLTRVIKALDYKGFLLILSRGDFLSERTERQREKGYTLLREFVDNFDSGRGAISTRVVLTGGAEFFVGPKSMQELAPLYARLAPPSAAEPPPPHRSWTSLVKDPLSYAHRRVRASDSGKPRALRSLIRLSQGLPPVDAVSSLSVGHERIDRNIDKLFHHAEISGSVFQVLCGEYGSGKTHLLLHLAERALEQGHPVFWLNLERMNLDLGNPARHLHRVLEQSILPGRGRASVIDRLAQWTRSPARLRELVSVLHIIAEQDSQESRAAKKALSFADGSDDPGTVLEEFLSGRDLRNKASAGTYRQEAYRRLLLWVELLRQLEGAEGPVILIDEAENLYTSGVSDAARRSALRTLAFYCGGTLPGACVLLAMTPPALAQMRRESKGLLREASELDSTLDIEDVELFRGRLLKLKPDEVPAFSQAMRAELAEKVRKAHRKVRGPVEMESWDDLKKQLAKMGGTPRVMMRRLVDELESAWWAAG